MSMQNKVEEAKSNQEFGKFWRMLQEAGLVSQEQARDPDLYQKVAAWFGERLASKHPEDDLRMAHYIREILPNTSMMGGIQKSAKSDNDELHRTNDVDAETYERNQMNDKWMEHMFDTFNQSTMAVGKEDRRRSDQLLEGLASVSVHEMDKLKASMDNDSNVVVRSLKRVLGKEQ